MNKILILMTIIFSSCGYSQLDARKGIVISEIEIAYISTDRAKECWCNYYGNGSWTTGTITSGDFKFRDSCGKFQIGDTLKIVTHE